MEAGRKGGRGSAMILAMLFIASLIDALNASIVNVALPTIATNFGVTMANSTWVILGYALPLAALLIPVGKICYIDNYGAMAYQYNESHPADTKEVFDGAIYGKCDAGTLHNRYLSMLSSMGQVRRGGMFAFLPEAFEELPCGRATAEALLKFMGFNLLVSSSEIQNIVRGERL